MARSRNASTSGCTIKEDNVRGERSFPGTNHERVEIEAGWRWFGLEDNEVAEQNREPKALFRPTAHAKGIGYTYIIYKALDFVPKDFHVVSERGNKWRGFGGAAQD